MMSESKNMKPVEVGRVYTTHNGKEEYMYAGNNREDDSLPINNGHEYKNYKHIILYQEKARGDMIVRFCEDLPYEIDGRIQIDGLDFFFFNDLNQPNNFGNLNKLFEEKRKFAEERKNDE